MEIWKDITNFERNVSSFKFRKNKGIGQNNKKKWNKLQMEIKDNNWR